MGAEKRLAYLVLPTQEAARTWCSAVPLPAVDCRPFGSGSQPQSALIGRITSITHTKLEASRMSGVMCRSQQATPSNTVCIQKVCTTLQACPNAENFVAD